MIVLPRKSLRWRRCTPATRRSRTTGPWIARRARLTSRSRPASKAPSKAGSRRSSVRRKAPPAEPETSTATEDTEAEPDAAAQASPIRQSGGFLSYLGFGNGREQAAAPQASRGAEEPAVSSSDARKTGPSGTDSSDFVDYTTAGEGKPQRAGMFGGGRRDLTSTDEEPGSEGPFSDDAGYAAPSRARERNPQFGGGMRKPQQVFSDSEGYTGSDVPMQPYDPKAPRAPRSDPTEGECYVVRSILTRAGECYAHLSYPPTYPELTLFSRIMLELGQLASFGVTTLAFNGLVIYALALYAFHNLSPFCPS